MRSSVDKLIAQMNAIPVLEGKIDDLKLKLDQNQTGIS